MAELSNPKFYAFDQKRARVVALSPNNPSEYVYEYLGPEVYRLALMRLAQGLNPEGAVVLTNLYGAKKLVDDLMILWANLGYNLRHTQVREIRYSSSDSSDSSGHVVIEKGIDPKWVKGKRVVVPEDIGDTNVAIKAIRSDAQAAGSLSFSSGVAILKEIHPRQKRHKYDAVGIMTPDVWLGGWGLLDFKQPGKPNFPRSEPRLVVKIKPEELTQIMVEIGAGMRLLADISQ